MPSWSGTFTERSEKPKSWKYVGQTEAGQTNTFWLGKDSKPMPMNEYITVEYKESEYERNGEIVKSKWINGFSSEQVPQTTTQIGGTTFIPGKPAKDTFPSVREQFIKEVVGGWCRAGLVLPVQDDLIAATHIAKQAWVRVVEAPLDPGEPSNMAPPNHEQTQDLNNQAFDDEINF